MADTVKDKAIQEWLKLAAREIAAFFGVTLPPMEGPAMEDNLNKKSPAELKALFEEGKLPPASKQEADEAFAEMDQLEKQIEAKFRERGIEPN